MKHKFLLAVVLAGAGVAAYDVAVNRAVAAWEMTGLTYHDYCPASAIKNRLCYFGGPFVADGYITEPSVYDPKDIGSQYVLNTFNEAPDQYGVERFWIGSEIVIPYTTTKWRRTVTRDYAYRLMDGLEILDDVGITELAVNTAVLVANRAGRQFLLHYSPDGCEVSFRGQFTDADQPLHNYIRDATLTFTDTDCVDL